MELFESYTEEFYLLYNSQICRLCGEENANGYPLFIKENDDKDLAASINMYLPLKISDDGKFPRWICPGCHLQVESTVQFFNLVISGQETLHELYRLQCFDEQNLNSNEIINSLQENDKRYSEKSLRSEENIFSNNHFLIKRTSIIGGGQPKKKRGRPKKVLHSIEAENNKILNEDSNSKQDSTGSTEPANYGRGKRRIKLPSRYQEVVRGKDLEKVYIEKGVIDRTDILSDFDDYVEVVDCNRDGSSQQEEVFGHIKNDEGVNLGDLVVIHNHKKMYTKFDGRGGTKKKTRFMCDICKICFYYEKKFLEHRLSHQEVRFECSECGKNFVERSSLLDHQIESGHKDERIIEQSDAAEENETSAIVDERYIENCQDTIDMSSEEDCFDKPCDEIAEAAKVLHDLQNNDSSKTSEISALNSSTDIIEFDEIEDDSKNEESNSIIKVLNSVESDVDSREDGNLENKDLKNIKGFFCRKCEISFDSIKQFLDHENGQNHDNRRYVCSKCNKRFHSKQLLQRHQVVHSSERPFTCKHCGSTYKAKQNLLNHIIIHTGEKPFHCTICEQKFAHKTSLNLHMRWHSGEKPFHCSECGKSFTQLGNMQEHMRIHTGERPFECQTCGKKFKTSSQCRMHAMRHETDRPLKCTMCEKSFVNTEEYKVHLRRHNNIKPFVCRTCGKSFIELCALKKHARLHTGEKPYTCPTCMRSFADRSNLKKHLKIHENRKKQLDDSDNTISTTSVKSTFKNHVHIDLSMINDKQLSENNDNTVVNNINDTTNDDSSVWDLIEQVNVEVPTSNTNTNRDILNQSNQVIYLSYPDLNGCGSKTAVYVVNNITGDATVDLINMQGNTNTNLINALPPPHEELSTMEVHTII